MRLGQHVRQREHDVFRRERLAVMPQHALAQFEGDGLAVVGHAPAFGQDRARLQVGSVLDEPVEDLADDRAGGRGRIQIEGPRRRLRMHHRVEHAAAHRAVHRVRQALGVGIGGGEDHVRK
ncbi:hypothetical protein G6F22_013543 [Rhizopus arrhizus]|nr:hypothetical protein G6F22_013543 [Rhizopus arrhizus]